MCFGQGQGVRRCRPAPIATKYTKHRVYALQVLDLPLGTGSTITTASRIGGGSEEQLMAARKAAALPFPDVPTCRGWAGWKPTRRASTLRWATCAAMSVLGS